MSYILEALRKSERERQSRQAPGIDAVVADVPPARRSWLPWALVGALVVINVVALSVFLLRDKPVAKVQPPTPVAVVTQPEVPLPVAPVAPAKSEPAVVKPLSAPPLPKKLAKETPKSHPQPPRAALDEEEPRLEAMPDLKLLNRPPTPAAKLRSASPEGGDTAYKINVLAYPAAESERFAIINMTKYFKGDRLPDGAVVEDIQPDGVILSRKGERLRIAH